MSAIVHVMCVVLLLWLVGLAGPLTAQKRHNEFEFHHIEWFLFNAHDVIHSVSTRISAQSLVQDPLQNGLWGPTNEQDFVISI